MIVENIKNIQNRIAAACMRSGRKPEEITIVAVTKTFGSEAIREAAEINIFDIGENYVQEMLRKRDQIQDPRIRWHFIGHLQTNKVKYISKWVHMVHSVDSVRLASEISRNARWFDRKINILVEVNTTDEASKYGIHVKDVRSLIDELMTLSNLQVSGLMTMGPMSGIPEESRRSFRMLRDISYSLNQDDILLPNLSMGMSSDFEVAIEEGATIVRLGSAIFGSRIKN